MVTQTATPVAPAFAPNADALQWLIRMEIEGEAELV
jgi:hypothetical protein